MTRIRILTETDLRRVVGLDIAAIDCVEQGFVTLAGGQVIMPPILSMAIKEHRGEVDVKTAYVPGLESYAIKMASGFFDNPGVGLPTSSGLMVLLSTHTGQVQALLLDNGYLTEIRTAAAGAVAARHLARADAASACVVGAGMQARLQLKALCLVRPIETATIWARDAARAGVAARELSAELGIAVTAVRDLAGAVSGADIVITTTPSKEPLIMANWLRPGQHLTAMGSDQHDKVELEPDCLIRADQYVPDRQSQTAIMGELRPAIAAGLIRADRRFAELGEVIAGQAPGRSSDQAITIADLTGTGVQDTAIATFAFDRAIAAGIGAIIDTNPQE